MRKLLVIFAVLSMAIISCNPDAKKAKELADKGDYREAIKYYKVAIKKDKDNPKLHNELGYVYRRAGHWESAVDEYMEAVRLKPDYLEANYNLGVVRLKMKNVVAAKKALDKAIEIDPHFSKALITQGLACIKLGLYDEAKKHLDTAMELTPDSSALHCNLVHYFKAVEKPKEMAEAKKRCEILKAEGK